MSNIISCISLHFSPASHLTNITYVPSGTFRVCHTAPLGLKIFTNQQDSAHLAQTNLLSALNSVIITVLPVFPSVLLTKIVIRKVWDFFISSQYYLVLHQYIFASLVWYVQEVGYQKTCSFNSSVPILKHN